MITTPLIHQVVQNWLGEQSWLGRQYQRQALQQAIIRAYVPFARQYPEWVDYLFDRRFLIQQAFPLFARSLEEKVWPSPVELVDLWAEQFTWFNQAMKQRHSAQLTPVVADFLRQLKRELAS